MILFGAVFAVAAHVAKHLFDQAISSELLQSNESDDTQRSVILVTNALQFLNHRRVDRIVVLQDGHIVEQGTHKELSSRNDSVFARYLSVLNETGVSGSLMEGCDISDEHKQVTSAARIVISR